MSAQFSTNIPVMQIGEAAYPSSPLTFSARQDPSKQKLVGPSQSVELLRPMQPADNALEPREPSSISFKTLNAHYFKNRMSIYKSQSPLKHSESKLSKQLSKGPDIQKVLKMRRVAYNFIKKTAKKTSIIRFLSNNQILTIERILDASLAGHAASKLDMSSLPVFAIKSQVILIWDFMFLISLLLSFIWYPFLVSFGENDEGFEYIIQFSFIVFLMTDTILNFNRARIERGGVIKERAKILKLYLHNAFFSDLTSFFCLLIKYIVQNSFGSMLLTILYIILNVNRVANNYQNIIQHYNVRGNLRDLLSLIGMLLSAFYIVHFIACIWHGAAYYSSNSINWLNIYNLSHLGNFEKYLVSFYWAAMTMTTVGYGDITPKNELEYLIANFTMLFACIFFAFTMNRVGTLLHSMQQRKSEFLQKLAVINHYMNQHKVDFELQSRVRSYLNYIWKAETEENIHEISSIIGRLSQQLQEELQFQVKGKTLQKSQILNHFSESLIKKASQIIQEVKFAPDEVIQNDDYSLYIFQQGNDMRLKPKGIKLKLKTQDTFGEYSFFTNQPLNIEAVSDGFQTILQVSRNKFMELLNGYPLDKELFFKKKDQILFEFFNSPFIERCPVCSSNQHTIQKCSLVFLAVDKEKVLTKYNYPHPNQREKFLRNAYRKHPTQKLSEENQLTVRVVVQRILDDATNEGKSLIQDDFIQDPMMSHGQIKINNNLPECLESRQEYASQMSAISPGGQIRQQNRTNQDLGANLLYMKFHEHSEHDVNVSDSPRKSGKQNLEFPTLKFQHSTSIVKSNGSLANPQMNLGITDSMRTIQIQDEIKEQHINQSFMQTTKYSLHEKNLDFGIMGFESMQMYQIYFPEGNFDVIIKKYSILKQLSKQMHADKKHHGTFQVHTRLSACQTVQETKEISDSLISINYYPSLFYINYINFNF